MPKLIVLLSIALCVTAEASPKRIVIIKADGLPGDLVERWVATTDPTTSRSALPWIERVFFEQGARVPNFYTRGISLSAPAWSMLDSGQHLVIRGNAEFDRYTMRVYDYLNFFPFYLASARSRRADMPGVEVLDQAGVPLFIDRYAPEHRYQGMQLLQRGVRWLTLRRGASNRIATRSPRQLFDEWQTGFGFSEAVNEQLERELIAHLAIDDVQYLDYFFGDYDHIAHLANDDASQFDTLKRLDGLVGRLWTAIGKSPRAAETIFVLLSDHGMNTDPTVYSQGFNLIRFFNSAEGGSHHLVTNRYPLTEYKIRGLDPFVSEVTTPSSDSTYLAGQSERYPTALLDLDGNERASVHLRNSDLNQVQIALQQIEKGGPDAGAARARVLALVERHRAEWTSAIAEIEEELAALRRAIDRQRVVVGEQPRKFTKLDRALDRDEVPKRERSKLESWERDEHGYGEYAEYLRRLLALRAADLEPSKFRVDRLVPRHAMGDRNSIYQLQNYAAGPATRINYFAALGNVRVRNNVQPGVSANPVDFVAVRFDPRRVDAEGSSDRAVFLYGDYEHQAVLLAGERDGRLMIRYAPVARLRESETGEITFERRNWAAGFPLRLFEDSKLDVPGGRAEWLSGWHSDEEWLAATHRTLYSDGVIGLAEHFGPLRLGPSSTLEHGAGKDAALLRRFAERSRRMAEPDMLVLASNHWNFNVRGFNPGGNHGSFFRVSTNSTLLLAGAGVRPGLVVERAYDSLSFLPTLARLAGLEPDVHSEPFPGRVIQELLR